MPVWCPKCHAMLAEGQKVCPVCGTHLSGPAGGKTNNREIVWISTYIIGIALIPILFALVIGAICVLVAN